MKIKTHWVLVPYTNIKRRIRVVLPDDYLNSYESYPVVYFHDGQNVLYDEESYSKTSWGILETINQNQLPKMIVVAIDNDEEKRLDEYSPWEIDVDEFMHRGGLGDLYGEFLVDIVKPMIDQTYRTKKNRKYTAMIGSSLGGVITAYLGIKHYETFGRLGIFSLASWIYDSTFANYLKQINKTEQKIFIQVGTAEGKLEHEDRKDVSQKYIDASIDYYSKLLSSGYSEDDIKLVVGVNAYHSEASWAAYLMDCLKFISFDW